MHLSFLKALILISLLSAGGIVCLFIFRLFCIRKLSNEKLINGIILKKNFFDDFSCILVGVSMFSNSLFVFLCRNFKLIFLRLKKCSVFFQIQKKCYVFLNHMRGAHSIKKKRSSGYWKKINGYKK